MRGSRKILYLAHSLAVRNTLGADIVQGLDSFRIGLSFAVLSAGSEHCRRCKEAYCFDGKFFIFEYPFFSFEALKPSRYIYKCKVRNVT